MYVYMHRSPSTAINIGNLYGDEGVLLITLNIDMGRHADIDLADDPMVHPSLSSHLGHQSSTSPVS